MEGVMSANDQQSLVSSFLEIAVGQTADTARQFLQATGWKLEEAIQLFYVGNEAGIMAEAAPLPTENIDRLADQASGVNENVALPGANENVGQFSEDEVRAPMPVIRDVLYDDMALYGAPRARLSQHEQGPGVWESDQGATSSENATQENLASLYRPPFKILFQGSFEKVAGKGFVGAKSAASVQDKWLLVNLQSTKEFSSHMLNRDTWANEAVSQTIITNFIFWQTYDDTTEGKKVCTYYKLESMPVVLLIDPITGQKMRSWNGMVHPDRFLEDLLLFLDSGPRDHHVTLSNKRPRETAHPQKTKEETNEEDEEMQRALAASMEGMKETSGTISKDKDEIITDKEEETSSIKMPTYPPLPEEPKGDRNLLCRVGVRLPDGRRVQRNFLRIDPIQLLWSFCYSQLKEAEARPFQLTQAIPGASKNLDYDCQSTFEESGLANSMVSVTWE
ncbi:hypothetical protein ACFX10_010885 [Malus domestica]